MKKAFRKAGYESIATSRATMVHLKDVKGGDAYPALMIRHYSLDKESDASCNCMYIVETSFQP